MNYLSLFEFPSGSVLTITTGEYNCSVCKAVAYNVTYMATATPDYSNSSGGKRRRFRFVNGNPVCNCSPDIWLSDGKPLILQVN